MQITPEDISLEASLLKSLAVKKNYDKFYKVLDTKKLIPITDRLLKNYSKYYEKYNEDIDWDTFYTEFTQNMSNDLDKDDISYYRETVFPLVQNAEIKDSLYTALLEREASSKIEHVIQSGFCHEKIHEIVTSLKTQLQIYRKDSDDSIFKLDSIDLSALNTDNGLTWFLPALQAGINSHMPGQFVLVSADSGAGKSAFCISQAVHVFKQLNQKNDTRPILYCTSEDTKEDLAGRFLSNLYKDKCTGGFEDVIVNFKRVNEHYTKHYNSDLFIGMSIRSPKDVYKIRTKIDMFNPSVVIIDMLDVLSDSLDINSLTKTYNEIRMISNDGVPIIGTTQAGNTSYQEKETGQYKHRKWLTEKDTSGSKGGGKQGAAYCMLMIGQDDDMPGVRYISTTKKKRGKNVRVTCKLTEQYSLYEELL